MNRKLLLTALSFLTISHFTHAQITIGSPAGTPVAGAVLELRDTTRGLLLPRMTQTHMNAISTPPDGLLIYNTSSNTIYQYSQTAAQWKPIVADSSEWFFEPTSAKLYLRRALNNADSFYYNTTSRKFMFADTRFYRTSTGGTFNLDEGNSDRFIFKTTASRFPRPLENLNSANIYSVYEVDNDTAAVNRPFEAAYYGLGADATVIPTATQRIGLLGGLRAFTTFNGADTLSVAMGVQSLVTLRGKKYIEVAYGINNSVAIRDSVTKVGQVTGIQNTISYVSPLGTPRIEGNLYGYFSSMSTALNGKVDGNAYGIFLGNVNAAGVGTNRNFGIFTNKGSNRFGDSVLITDGSAFRARTVLDVNTTAAMIIPTGTTAQRPTILYTGMLRFNTDNSTPEAFTGSSWVNLKTPIIAATALLDAPLIPNLTTGTVIYTLTGVAVGNTVSISPANPLPDGIVIAWAQVNAVNQVTVGFANFSGAGVDLPAQTFYIKVIQ
ncbi:MAG: hypothetical protein NTW29_03980 [Bacteroidetes bacterium]|nr:hypothetical protein [Bacteroidota bacterium]